MKHYNVRINIEEVTEAESAGRAGQPPARERQTLALIDFKTQRATAREAVRVTLAVLANSDIDMEG